MIAAPLRPERPQQVSPGQRPGKPTKCNPSPERAAQLASPAVTSFQGFTDTGARSQAVWHVLAPSGHRSVWRARIDEGVFPERAMSDFIALTEGTP